MSNYRIHKTFFAILGHFVVNRKTKTACILIRNASGNYVSFYCKNAYFKAASAFLMRSTAVRSLSSDAAYERRM